MSGHTRYPNAQLRFEFRYFVKGLWQ